MTTASGNTPEGSLGTNPELAVNSLTAQSSTATFPAEYPTLATGEMREVLPAGRSGGDLVKLEERSMLEHLKSLVHDEEGLTTVEYALLLALVVVGAIVAWQGLGNTVENTVTASSGTIANAGA